jgi:hypothetical protein
MECKNAHNNKNYKKPSGIDETAWGRRGFDSKDVIDRIEVYGV